MCRLRSFSVANLSTDLFPQFCRSFNATDLVVSLTENNIHFAKTAINRINCR